MNLRTSYFNFTMFKSNIKRFWWIGVCYLIAFMTVGVLMLVDSSNVGGFVIMNGFTLAFAAIMTVILFSYLNNSQTVTFIHAFPIKRRAHFITNIVTVYALIIVPAVISYIVAFCYAIIEAPLQITGLKDAFFSLIISSTISVAGGLLGTMITGNPIASVAFSGLVIAFPFYSEGIIKSFLYENLYGMSGITVYTIENFSIRKVNWFMIIFLLVAIVQMFAAWYLYKKRALETNGDIISFKFLKPVFMAFASAFSGTLGYFYFNSFFDNSIFYLLPFGIIGIIASYMLSKKTLNIKGAWKGIIVYVLSVLVIYFVITFDMTGFERRIPDIDDIESVDMLSDSEIENYERMSKLTRKIGEKEYTYKNPLKVEDFRIYDKAQIEDIINMHKYFIENRDEEKEVTVRVPIRYNLKNGRKLKRVYKASYISDKEALQKVYSQKNQLLRHHEWLINKEPVVSIEISDERNIKNQNRLFMLLTGDDERTKILIDALIKDLETATYEDIISTKNSPTTITIEYNREMVDAFGEPVAKEFLNHTNQTDSFSISPGYKRTVALLNKWGLTYEIPKDLSYAKIEFNYGKENSYKITDYETVKRLYEYVTKNRYMPEKNKVYPKEIYDVCVRFYDAKDKNIYSQDLVAFIHNEPLEVLGEYALNYVKEYHKQNENAISILTKEY